MIKQLFFPSSAPVTGLLTESTFGFPMTGFGSFCQSATVLQGGPKKRFQAYLLQACLTNSCFVPLTLKRRPLTGRRFSVSALTHWKISHAERKDGNICLNV